jgi:hypothetical protein
VFSLQSAKNSEEERYLWINQGESEEKYEVRGSVQSREIKDKKTPDRRGPEQSEVK